MSRSTTSNWSSPNATSTSRGCRAAPRGRVFHAIVLAAAALSLAGCQGKDLGTSLDQAVKSLLTPQRNPQQNLLVAVASVDADARREALVKVAKSDQFNAEWAIKGYVPIALLEDDPQVRCIAIRALGRTGDPRATETMLIILNYRQHPPQSVRPPDDVCRWDATEVLADLSERGQVPDGQKTAVFETLARQLRSDTNRHARIAAARGLAHYPSTASLEALIAGLRDADFAVVHQCENALVHLTGTTLEADAYAWHQWLEANRADSFVHAGEVPASRRPPYGNKWEKLVWETRDLIGWLWPGAKEE